MADLSITWNKLDLASWQNRFARLVRPSLLQSYDYARAQAMHTGQRPRWGQIFINGMEAGLVQAFEMRLMGGLFHFIACYQAPLWYPEFNNCENTQLFWQHFDAVYPKRLGRIRRFLPVCDSDVKAKIQTGTRPYQTYWIDLRPDMDHLKAALGRQWRHHLRQAHDQNLTVKWFSGQQKWPWLRAVYIQDRLKKRYTGASPKLMDKIVQYFGKNCDIGIAYDPADPSSPICAMLLLLHVPISTWQIGWVSDRGRALCANHALLWSAMARLKDKNIHFFDLGGVNDHRAKQILSFKKKMGGTLVESGQLYI
jgi:hypothetical protein